MKKFVFSLLTIFLSLSLIILVFSDDKKESKTYLFESNFAEGDKLTAELKLSFSAKGKVKWEGVGDRKGTIADDTLETKNYEYKEVCVGKKETQIHRENQEPRTISGMAFDRTFTKASREFKDFRENKKQTEIMSLKDKTVTVVINESSKEPQVDTKEMKILPQELVDITFNEKISSAILPKTEVKLGDKWDIDTARLFSALNKKYFDGSGFKGEAKAILKEETKIQGKNCVKILLTIKGTIEQTTATMGGTFNLQGSSVYSLDNPRIISFDLSGNITSMKGDLKIMGRRAVSFEGTGSISWKYSVKIE